MATELSEQAIQVITKSTAMTLSMLKSVVQTLLSNRFSLTHGEQTLKKLNMQNTQLDCVQLAGDDLKGFRKSLNQYAVDFSVKKDKTTGLHTVFFKGRDIDRIYLGLDNCMKGLSIDRSIGNNTKKQIKEVMQNAVQRATTQTMRNTAPQRSSVTDRGYGK